MKRVALLLPSIFFFSFYLVAIVSMGRLSLYQTEPGVTTFVGVQNFIRIFTDPMFLRKLANTFAYVGIVAFGQTGLALLIALAIRDIKRAARSAMMFLLYIPVFVSGVIIASVWRWVFAADGGLLNWILGTDVVWMLYRWTSIVSLSFIIIVSGMGFLVIVFTVSLASIPTEIIEAARIDGANRRNTRRRILIPMVWPMVSLMFLLMGMGSFLIWEVIQMMGPIQDAQNIMFDMYTTAFALGHYGLASAKALVIVVLVVAFAVVKRRIEA